MTARTSARTGSPSTRPGDHPRHARRHQRRAIRRQRGGEGGRGHAVQAARDGQFRPGTDFKEFFFDATGDTNANSTANAEFGGWGGIYRLTQSHPGADSGKLQLFFAGNKEHTGLDNGTFIDKDHVSFVEDAGDGLHAQRGALDSAYLFDVRVDYSKGDQPVRFIAEGRDFPATLDNMLGALGNGFQNEGDNEITGIHFSDGDATVGGILGAKIPKPFRDGWRLFWTQ